MGFALPSLHPLPSAWHAFTYLLACSGPLLFVCLSVRSCIHPMSSPKRAKRIFLMHSPHVFPPCQIHAVLSSLSELPVLPESAVHANRHFQIASIMACLHVVLSQISSWRCDSTHKTMMQHDSVKRSSIAWHAVSIRHIPAADSFNKEKQSLRFSAITTGAS